MRYVTSGYIIIIIIIVVVVVVIIIIIIIVVVVVVVIEKYETLMNRSLLESIQMTGSLFM
jgi:hypothetical protein